MDGLASIARDPYSLDTDKEKEEEGKIEPWGNTGRGHTRGGECKVADHTVPEGACTAVESRHSAVAEVQKNRVVVDKRVELKVVMMVVQPDSQVAEQLSIWVVAEMVVVEQTAANTSASPLALRFGTAVRIPSIVAVWLVEEQLLQQQQDN